MYIEWQSEICTTTWEKARGAVKLKKVLLQAQWKPGEARKTIRHEYAHAKADSGPGVFGLECAGLIPYYGPVGPRSEEELQKMAFAPDNPSIYDKVAVIQNRFSFDFLESLIKRVHSFKLPFRR